MKKKSIFLDTNFLVATQVEGHQFFEEAIEIRKHLLQKEWELYICPTLLDEFWYVLRGLWKIETNNNLTDLHKHLTKATKNIMAFANLTSIQPNIDGEDSLEILETMNKYGLRPRDSMIIHIMRKQKIKYIASFDSDFDNIRGIERIKSRDNV